MVGLEAIQKFGLDRSELHSFSVFIDDKNSKPCKIGSELDTSRSDHTKIVKKIEQIADKINLEVKAYVYSTAPDSIVREKYKITENLIESTFSHIYMVI